MKVMLLVLALSIGPALAHEGDGDWIGKHDYKSAMGLKCCGSTDCERMGPADVEPTSNGIWLPRFKELVPYNEATPSEDEFNYRCAIPTGYLSRQLGHRTCFFFRYGAS